ncbi:MAG: protein-export membrane protein SecF [Candidatus Moranbacteria bacterium RIFOXYA12_FULL_35_19]|uniref:Protein-export membrane protein SecF n=1 Tax=Candidatus Magasanikbacteria bacterium GW2011_GWE2_42_7 TaxID=1619052 RepID=A0A0G1B9V8_9BACT|nr:MAG: Protein translocase subunit SecF [Candidatus Moranbacteria bacterium GW2011_GWF2_35_39]KKS70082.1 MAG: Protein translocase subunit SecF [Candidatus Magasanikbacteria bacterium GW2011_GWE2_42_7]OGI32706.1 MAG: protein-export membrane protein SecF [Candidatus Moranbacteria bacterium RIFOXYC12_FULL_36_13]OGI36692.1 MAG: protein-export membrane protein SecF [Candidatus Moranbacteria bacterium RIFOXYA12_FULL_35_19]
MINIISKTKYAYIFSITLTILSVVSLFVWGLKFGIDFTGGTLMEVSFENSIPANQEIEETLKDLNLKSLTIQSTQNNSALIRYASEDDTINQNVFKKISEKYPNSKELRVDYANASVSNELKSKSLWAIFWAVAGILAYIAWAFRKVSRPVASWKYGIGAVIALVHDILITTGAFSVLGHFYGIEVGIPFIAALLTILGFSVHDTIVVYDRTRENLLRSSNKETFPDIVNRSLNETLVRSVNTSLTVLITLLAVFIFGGATIRDFSLALLIGVFFGTYSSIFIASALLVTSYKLQINYKSTK